MVTSLGVESMGGLRFLLLPSCNGIEIVQMFLLNLLLRFDMQRLVWVGNY